MYSQRYLTLPGGLKLPVALCMERITTFETTDEIPTDLSWLEERARSYILSQMLSGEIRSSNTQIYIEDDFCGLYGTYRCRELIGRVRSEEN